MDEKQVTTNEIMEVLHKQQDILLNQQGEQKNILQVLQKQSNDHADLMGFLEEHMVVKEEFESRFNLLDAKINRTKLELIDAMDEKIGALKGDLVVMMRSEDKKLNSLVHLLAERKVLDDTAVHSILTMQPFPQLFVTH